MSQKAVVLRLVSDCWDGVFNHEEVLEAPTPANFEQFFGRMDAQVYTMIALQSSGYCHMGIGGGSGRYVVYATFDNETFWNLISGAGEPGKIMLNAGGQEGEYPARHVVTLAEARQVGLAFLASGELDRSLPWEKQ